MRLMNPGLGEMLDRLSILELKLAHGGGEQFEEERLRILDALPLNKPEDELRRLTAYAKLAAVNAALWQSEDALRDLRPREMSTEEPQVGTPPPRDVVVKTYFLAHKIQLLNDRRAELVREIGKLAGEEEHREKLSGGQG